MPRLAALSLASLALAGCATMDAQVKLSAARDFACREEALRIIDHELSLYRVSGCGSVATYDCKETQALAVRCTRVPWDEDETREIRVAGGSYRVSPGATSR